MEKPAAVRRVLEQIGAADALVIACTEYNLPRMEQAPPNGSTGNPLKTLHLSGLCGLVLGWNYCIGMLTCNYSIKNSAYGGIMIQIKAVDSGSSTQVSSTTASKTDSAVAAKSAESPDAPASQSPASTISALARQLANSAARIAALVQTTPRKQLGDFARGVIDQIAGDTYQANKAKHDAEVPATDDPELQARAKQATAYVNRTDNKSVRNPFAGLSREQLANIVYDDSGTYTVNERQAAWSESQRQEEVWREKVCAEGIAEYDRTGKMTHFFKSVLEHYQGLPAIEQAQYPADYESKLEYLIQLDFNFRTNQAEGKGTFSMSLVESLFDGVPQSFKPIFSEESTQ